MGLKEKAVKGVKITALAFLIVKLSALIRQVILARILMPSDFGLMAFCLVVVGFLQNSIDLKIHEAVIHTKENEKDMLNTGFTIQFFIAVICIISVLIFSQKISHILQKPLIAIYLRVLAFRILTPVFMMPQALLHRRFDYKSVKIPEIADSLVNTLVAIGLAIRGYGMWSLIWGLMSGWIVWAIIVFVIAGGFPKISFNFILLKKALKFGFPLYLTFLLNWGFWNADDFIVGKLLGNRALGYYWMAFYLAHHLIDLKFILSRVSFPVFVKLQENKNQMAEALTKLTKSTAFIFFLIAALFIPLARPTLAFIFGEKWIPATIPFMIFIGVVSLRAIFGHGGELLMGVAKTRYMIIISLVQFLILLMLGPFAASKFGIVGMAIIVALGVFLSLACLTGYVKKTVTISYIKILWKGALIAFAIGFVAFLSKALITGLTSFILVMAGCTALYIALFIIFDKLFMERLKSYLLMLLKV